MSKWDKLLERIREGTSDANIPFDDVCYLLQREGWQLRMRGSHHWFWKDGFEALNLQPHRRHVKRYQVKQIREAFLEKGYSA